MQNAVSTEKRDSAQNRIGKGIQEYRDWSEMITIYRYFWIPQFIIPVDTSGIYPGSSQVIIKTLMWKFASRFVSTLALSL